MKTSCDRSEITLIVPDKPKKRKLGQKMVENTGKRIGMYGSKFNIDPFNLKEPKQRAGTLKDYKKNYLSLYESSDYFEDDQFPCTNCRGIGTIYDPNDPPDVNEGNRNRARITCPKCDGKYIQDERSFKRAWKLKNHECEEDIKDFKEKVKILKELNKKLSEKEINAIHSYFSIW